IHFSELAMLHGTSPTPPYCLHLACVLSHHASHSFPTRRSSDLGNTTTSTPVTLTVNIPDTTPPTAAISSPSSGTSYTTAQSVTLQATHTDNVHVPKDEFYDGATLRGSDTNAPYSFDWTFAFADN